MGLKTLYLGMAMVGTMGIYAVTVATDYNREEELHYVDAESVVVPYELNDPRYTGQEVIDDINNKTELALFVASGEKIYNFGKTLQEGKSVYKGITAFTNRGEDAPEVPKYMDVSLQESTNFINNLTYSGDDSVLVLAGMPNQRGYILANGELHNAKLDYAVLAEEIGINPYQRFLKTAIINKEDKVVGYYYEPYNEKTINPVAAHLMYATGQIKDLAEMDLGAE